MCMRITVPFTVPMGIDQLIPTSPRAVTDVGVILMWCRAAHSGIGESGMPGAPQASSLSILFSTRSFIALAIAARKTLKISPLVRVATVIVKKADTIRSAA